MKTTPETVEQKYLFLVDNQELAFAIVCAGFSSTTLLSDERGYYDVDSFIKYMDEISCTGTSQADYIYPTELFGKLLNACADIPSTAMESVDIIKKAVGEDTLLYEKKGQDPTQFNSYAKLLFSANEMPLNLDDKTNAYYRRLLVLDMNRAIPEDQKDSLLKEKLFQESD